MKQIKLSKEAYAELRKCIDKGQASFDTWGSDLHKEIYKALEGVNLVTIYGLIYVCHQTGEGGCGQGSYPSRRVLVLAERVEIVPESGAGVCQYCNKVIAHHTQSCISGHCSSKEGS